MQIQWRQTISFILKISLVAQSLWPCQSLGSSVRYGAQCQLKAATSQFQYYKAEQFFGPRHLVIILPSQHHRLARFYGFSAILCSLGFDTLLAAPGVDHQRPLWWQLGQTLWRDHDRAQILVDGDADRLKAVFKQWGAQQVARRVGQVVIAQPSSDHWQSLLRHYRSHTTIATCESRHVIFWNTRRWRTARSSLYNRCRSHSDLDLLTSGAKYSFSMFLEALFAKPLPPRDVAASDWFIDTSDIRGS